MESKLTKAAAFPACNRKPMADVSRVNLFDREVREKVSIAALELLLARADILSEGKISEKEKTGGKYYGSSMITMNLQEAADYIRDPLDAHSALKLVEMLPKDRRFRNLLRVIAEREAGKTAGVPFECLEFEISVEVDGARILIDLDVEADPGPRQLKLGNP